MDDYEAYEDFHAVEHPTVTEPPPTNIVLGIDDFDDCDGEYFGNEEEDEQEDEENEEGDYEEEEDDEEEDDEEDSSSESASICLTEKV